MLFKRMHITEALYTLKIMLFETRSFFYIYRYAYSQSYTVIPGIYLLNVVYGTRKFNAVLTKYHQICLSLAN